jgi:hypothetical protein
VRGTAFGLLLVISLNGPRCQKAQAPSAEIALEMFPQSTVDGVPTAFSFVLRNISSAEIYIPPPNIDCGNPTARGSIWLSESWVQASGDGLWKGKGSCDFGGVYPSPAMTLAGLTSSWKRLQPGESVEITADQKALHYDVAKSGTYVFSAEYLPPNLSVEVRQLLSGSGIAVPTRIVRTPDQRYVGP